MTLTRSLLEDSTSLTQKQAGLVEEIETILSEPLAPAVPPPQRSPERTRASKELHKRTNPAFVDLPYRSSNEVDFKYRPPPDWSREHLKVKSDCDFQGFATIAILNNVDLNKTSH